MEVKDMSEKKTKRFKPLKIVIVRPLDIILEEAIEKGNLFEGVALSVVHLESSCIRRLRIYLKKKGIKRPHPFLERLSLRKASRILEKLGIIDPKTHSLIGEINEYRNKVIHEFMTPDMIEPDKAKDIFKKAIECMKAIANSYRIEEE